MKVYFCSIYHVSVRAHLQGFLISLQFLLYLFQLPWGDVGVECGGHASLHHSVATTTHGAWGRRMWGGRSMWEGGEGGCSKESVCEGRRLIMPLQSCTREEIHQLTCHISLYSHLMHQSTVLRASQHETSSDPGEVGNYKGKEER